MYAISHECPNCGAPVPFPSAIAVFAVCAHCRSSVVRRDAQVEIMGQQAQLPPDLSPLRVGTRGSFDGRAFSIIGRVRMGYREGSWNEWCADFGEGVWGWIAEAQGTFAVSFEVPATDDLPGADAMARRGASGLTLSNLGLAVGRDAMAVGRHVVIDRVGYTVRDRKQTAILASEGSLPFAAVPGRSAISADLAGPGRAFANLEYSDEGIRVFVGRSCTFGELGFAELAPLPGWTAGAVAAENRSDALNCVACGAALQLRAPGLTMAAVCPACGALVDTSHPQVQMVDIAARRLKPVPTVIPIGRRGTLLGTEYECIGMMQRRDGAGDSWQEYLLFNPFAGFRWLVTYEGHWTFVEVLLEEPRQDGAERVHDGRSYRLASRGFSQVTYVVGEFYWQVRLRERTEVEEYVAPPRVLASEKYPDLAETTWSAGTYLEAGAVAAAFGLGDSIRPPAGVTLGQPNPHAAEGATLRWLAPLVLAAYVAVALVSAVSRAREPVGEWHFTPGQAGTNGTLVTDEFRIGGSHAQSLEIELSSAVHNGWLEAGIDLVDLDTQATREAAVENDFYEGNDDGHWEEGSRQRSVVLSAVPPGRYRLVVEPKAEPNDPNLAFDVRLTRDVMLWSNFWLGFVGLAAYPAYRWLREHAFERERWAASDFSPFTPVGEWLSADGDSDSGSDD
jgi:hypothetical protein